jgi:hypothetical protein
VSDREYILGVVREINACWREKRYDRIGDWVVDDAVIAPPGGGERFRGREAYVQSYRDYDSAATTLEFEAGEPAVDIVADTAVAVCPFRVVYEIDGATYRERGDEILVFERSEGQWKIAWRTMRAVSEDDGAG